MKALKLTTKGPTWRGGERRPAPRRESNRDVIVSLDGKTIAFEHAEKLVGEPGGHLG
jgi:hypothetical protein